MEKSDFLELCDKYARGLATKEEQESVESFLKNLDSNVSADKNISDSWSSIQRKNIEDRIRAKVQTGLNQELPASIRSSPSFIRPNQRAWLVAASLTLILALFTIFKFQPSIEDELVTVFTEKAEKKEVTLPDGSTVILNAASQITYPPSFDDLDTREVRLIGQGFFDVKKNPEKPFIITSGKIMTTVLGTSFEILAYPEDSHLKVSVKSGKVNVSNQLTEKVLGPNEQAVYSKLENSLIKSFVRFETLSSWQEGQLVLNGSLKEVSPQIERAFDVEIDFKKQVLENCSIDAMYNNGSLEDVLKGLSFSLGLTYELNDRKVTFSGDSCN